jgi:hypothetical protein
VALAAVPALAAALAVCAPAAADGDPPSDILTTQDVYYGVGVDLRSKAAAQLPAMLERARAEGVETKVALVSDFADLGIATHYWKQPQDYAKFLAGQLALLYKERVLVLMPGGYGFWDTDRSGLGERALLRDLDPPRRPRDFLASAIDAVRKLAAAEGVRLEVPDVEPPPGGMTQPVSHFARPVGTAPPLPTATPRDGAGGAADGGGPSAALFFGPFAIAGLVAVGLIVVRRRREGRVAAGPKKS